MQVVNDATTTDAARVLPRFPVYVPSKGRAKVCMTPRFLVRDRVPFFLVVEPQEEAVYRKRFPPETTSCTILTLPKNDGGLIYARNWIRDHAEGITGAGQGRHWQLDDNINYLYRRYRATLIPCNAGIALRVVEDFTERYDNIAISGLNYAMFVPDERPEVPLIINCRVYSLSLINHAMPYRWRLAYNDDTDICLQALSSGEWCTVLVNAFTGFKVKTMKIAGGNTDALYRGEGRLKMARALERVWPGVVETDRRFHRPQHVVKYSWRHFDTPLRLKPGVDLEALRGTVNEYGMQLTQVAAVKSPRVQGILKDWWEDHPEARPTRQRQKRAARPTASPN